MKRKILEIITSRNVYSSVGSEDGLAVVKQFISTGSLKNDIFLGGGIPVRRIIEIYGPNGGGKTALSFHVMQDTQKKGGIVYFLSTEISWDRKKASAMGVNVDEVIVLNPEHIEQVQDLTLSICKTTRTDDPDNDILDTKELDKMIEDAKTLYDKILNDVDDARKKAIDVDLTPLKEAEHGLSDLKITRAINNFRIRSKTNSELPILIVLDSLNQCPTLTSLEFANADEEGTNQYAKGMMDRPRVIGEMMRQITVPVAVNDVAFVILNQIMTGPGMGNYGTDDYETNGGNQAKHTYSMRIDMDFKSRTADGQITKMRSKKNRFQRPNVRWEVYQSYYTGFDYWSDLKDVMTEMDEFESGKGWESLKGKSETDYWDKGDDLGYTGFVDYMKKHPKMLEIYDKKVREYLVKKIETTDWLKESDYEAE